MPAESRTPRARAARHRRVVRRRRVVGSILAGLLTVAFTLVLRAALRSAWPDLPFPQGDGLLAVAGVSFAFGFVVRRWWAIVLAIGIVPLAAHTSGSGLAGGFVGLLVAGPYAILGFGGGVALSRALLRPGRLGAAGAPRRPAPSRTRRAHPA